MRWFFIFIYSSFLIPLAINGKETSESFMVEIFDKNIRVVSPSAVHDQLSVIVENKGNSKLLGKLVKEKGEVIKFFALGPGEHGSASVQFENGYRLFYIPLSPAFQTVELIIGKDAYEIPPRP